MDMLVTALLMASTATPVTATPSPLDRLAAGLGYRVTVVDNRPAYCPPLAIDPAAPPPPTPLPPRKCMVLDIDLDIPADVTPPADLELRTSLIGSVLLIDSAEFTSRLVNGDVTVFALKPGRSLEAGRHYRIRLTASVPFFSRAFVLPNAALAAPGAAPVVIAAARPGTDPETGLETLPYVAPMTDEPRLATAAAADRNVWLTPVRAFARYAARGAASTPDVVILPAPAQASRPAGAALDLSQGVRVQLRGVSRAALAPALAGLEKIGIGTGAVPLSIVIGDPSIAAEGYRLDVTTTGIRIAARDSAGASYALRSLAQQATHERLRMKPLAIVDAPRFGYRGLHLDLARNFHGRDEILRVIEQMAAVKLNTLHLHLGDDEGWRMDIPALPELTRVGAYRCLDLSDNTCLQPQLGANPARDSPTNGYLTTQDYLAILAAAKARQITVVPSFDMPGHSRAAIKAMEARYRRLMAAGRPAEAERYRLVEPDDTTRYRSIQTYDDNTLNVCIPATYRFVDTVVSAMARLHARAGVPLGLYHIGADETAGAWRNSPACLAEAARTGTPIAHLGARFVERVAAMLAKRGIRAGAWSDGLTNADPAALPAQTQSYVWGGLFDRGVAEAHSHANRGWPVILSMPDVTYLDMPQAVSPDEPGATWATREIDLFRLYAFMPGNLPANAATMTDILNRPGTIDDATPLAAGHMVAGIQGQLWSEMVRCDSQVEYMLFPRLFALAERGWSRASWEPGYTPGARYSYGDARIDVGAMLGGWSDFAGRVADRLPALDHDGIVYRLTPPGARIVAGRLEANSELLGMPIDYRTQNGEWTHYTSPVAVQGAVELRTATPDGKRFSRIVTVAADRAPWQ
ncbi:MAG: carbohydate-binding domain-containing protein [Sphingomonas phyllosphaerae]|uniref:family 20 glycosylhydrolase n=1 Tax=Sphingomonas phyllosphaerae TaxID=257003 RepID=UPI002FFCA46E